MHIGANDTYAHPTTMQLYDILTVNKQTNIQLRNDITYSITKKKTCQVGLAGFGMS